MKKSEIRDMIKEELVKEDATHRKIMIQLLDGLEKLIKNVRKTKN